MATKYLVLDTETAGNGEKPSVYDLAWSVTDDNGATYIERRYIVSEIWNDNPLMKNAYYAHKIASKYQPLIEDGTLPVVPLQTARLQMLYDMITHGVTCVYAFNASFDHGALDNTVRTLSNGYVTSFLPETVEWRCIMGFAQDIICCTEDYVGWCVKHRFLTDSGNPMGSAEILYRYISRDTQFVESHTALDDVRIESEIMRYALNHKGIKVGSWRGGSRWRKMRDIKNAIAASKEIPACGGCHFSH